MPDRHARPSFSIRLPVALQDRLYDHIEAWELKRNTFIVEAIEEKLRREASKILAAAYWDRIEIALHNGARWIEGDDWQPIETISVALSAGPGEVPNSERAEKALAGHGWQVIRDEGWHQGWDGSRGLANGTLERDPIMVATVERDGD